MKILRQDFILMFLGFVNLGRFKNFNLIKV